MGREARPEEALLPGEGAVDKLVDDDKVAGGQRLTQRADGRQGYQVRAARTLQDIDVRARVYVRGR